MLYVGRKDKIKVNFMFSDVLSSGTDFYLLLINSPWNQNNLSSANLQDSLPLSLRP
eukprot:gene1851-1130_t